MKLLINPRACFVTFLIRKRQKMICDAQDRVKLPQGFEQAWLYVLVTMRGIKTEIQNSQSHRIWHVTPFNIIMNDEWIRKKTRTDLSNCYFILKIFNWLPNWGWRYVISQYFFNEYYFQNQLIEWIFNTKH